jgi:hypothetical protein
VEELSTQTSLFPEPIETRIQRIDTAIASLLFGFRGGPLNLRLADDEKAVLEMIRYHRGSTNAVNLRDIHQRTKLDGRTIKQAVRTLRLNFHVPIGSSKHATNGGYFVIISAQDCSAWVKEVLDQVKAELSVVRAAAGNRAVLDLLGQLSIDFTGGADL